MTDKNFGEDMESNADVEIRQQNLTEGKKKQKRILFFIFLTLIFILAIIATILYLDKDSDQVIEENVLKEVQRYDDPDVEERVFHISQLNEFLDFRYLSELSEDARLISTEKTEVLTVTFTNQNEVTFGLIPLATCRPVTDSGEFDETEGYSFCLETPFVISARPYQFGNQFPYLGGNLGIRRNCAETRDELENDCVKERVINRLVYSINEKFDAILYSGQEYFTEEMKEKAILAQEEFKQMESKVVTEEFNLLHYKVGYYPNESGSFTIVTDLNDNIVSIIRLGMMLP